MKISENLNRVFKRMFDWIISVLVTVITLGLGVLLWGEYVGLSGFIKDFLGVLTTTVPVPFWVATLVGVALGISFYRKRSSYSKLISQKK